MSAVNAAIGMMEAYFIPHMKRVYYVHQQSDRIVETGKRVTALFVQKEAI